MRFRILLAGKEIKGNVPCKFCPDGTVDVSFAEKRFRSDHAVLERMKDKEKWLRKWADLTAKVKKRKIRAYDFFFENWQLTRDYGQQGYETVTSTVSEDVRAECNKCKKPAYLRMIAEIDAPTSEAVQMRELYDLELADNDTMKRIAARMRRFPTYSDFEAWIAGGALKKAAKIMSETVKKLDALTSEEEEVARLIGVLKEMPSHFEEKLRQRRFDLLQEVKKQLQVDKPIIGEIE